MIDPMLRQLLKKKYGEEKVLIISNKYVDNIPDGFSEGIPRNFKGNVTQYGRFIYRYDAEYSSLFTQLIPYVIVFNKPETKIYATERVNTDESRLNDVWQLGACGHICPSDLMMDFNPVDRAAWRELNEELKYSATKDTREYPLKLIGTVRSLSSQTKEHLGIVYVCQAATVSVRETKQLRGKWLDMLSLVEKYEQFEDWGRQIIDQLYLNYKATGAMLSPYKNTRYGRRGYHIYDSHS